MRVFNSQVGGTSYFIVQAMNCFQGKERHISQMGLIQICRYKLNGIPLINKLALHDRMGQGDDAKIKINTINGNGWFIDSLKIGNFITPYYQECLEKKTNTLTEERRSDLGDHWYEKFPPLGVNMQQANFQPALDSVVGTANNINSDYFLLSDRPEQTVNVSLEFKVHLVGSTQTGYWIGPGFYWTWRPNNNPLALIASEGIGTLHIINLAPDDDIKNCLLMYSAYSRNSTSPSIHIKRRNY